MRQPLDNTIIDLYRLPYTISYVIRKRIQVDSLNEIPKDKRPPELMIWDGTPEEIDEWLEDVFQIKDSRRKQKEVFINIGEIEG